MGVAAATLVEVRARAWRHFDLQLLLYVLLLVGVGIVMGISVSYGDPIAAGTSSQTFKTFIWAGIGLSLFFVAASVDYRWLQTLAVPIYLVVLGVLLLTTLFGTSLFGARMSVTLGGLDVQLSEISKVLMIVVLATYLAARREHAGRASTIVVAGVLTAIPSLLIFRQPDLGTALVFVVILVGMLFLGGASLGWMGVAFGAVVAAAPVAVGMLHVYQRQRLFCFLDPYADAQGACYQLVQALNAVGSGGLLGQGLTAGRHNQLGYLPVQSTDFIFTVVAEELGFIGGVIVLALFGLLVWRILVIGWRSGDALGAMLAAGLASMVVFQVMVNVGMVLGLMPVTGIPLPFVTYGGSSLVSLLFGMGILQSVRMRSTRPGF